MQGHRRLSYKARPEMPGGVVTLRYAHKQAAERHRHCITASKRCMSSAAATATAPSAPSAPTSGYYGQFGVEDTKAPDYFETYGVDTGPAVSPRHYDSEDDDDGPGGFDGYNGFEDVGPYDNDEGQGDPDDDDDDLFLSGYVCNCGNPACAQRRLSSIAFQFASSLHNWQLCVDAGHYGTTNTAANAADAAEMVLETALAVLQTASQVVQHLRTVSAVNVAVQGMNSVLCHASTPFNNPRFASEALVHVFAVFTRLGVHNVVLRLPVECLEAALGCPEGDAAKICTSLSTVVDRSLWLKVLWGARVPLFMLGHALRDPDTHASAAAATQALKMAFDAFVPQHLGYYFGDSGDMAPPREALAIAVEFVHTVSVACVGAHPAQGLRVLIAVAATRHPELVGALAQAPTLAWAVQAVAHAPDAAGNPSHWTVVALALELLTVLADVAREVEAVATFLCGTNVWAALRTATFVAHGSRDMWAGVAGAVAALLQCHGGRGTGPLELYNSEDAISAVCTLLAAPQAPVCSTYIAQQIATQVVLRSGELTRSRPTEAGRAAAVLAAIGVA
jgi:hypothetical protein